VPLRARLDAWPHRGGWPFGCVALLEEAECNTPQEAEAPGVGFRGEEVIGRLLPGRKRQVRRLK